LLHILELLIVPLRVPYTAQNPRWTHFQRMTLPNFVTAKSATSGISLLAAEFTALENVAMPLLARGELFFSAGKSLSLAAQVGLKRAVSIVQASFPAASSSGWRWLGIDNAAQLLLADEPTGDLDGGTAEVVFDLLARLHREHQLTSLIATHNLAFARRCHRVLRLDKGKMEEWRRIRSRREDRRSWVAKAGREIIGLSTGAIVRFIWR